MARAFSHKFCFLRGGAFRVFRLQERTAMTLPEMGRDIFRAAINAVLPDNMMRQNLVLEDGRLRVGNKSYPLQNNLYLVGFGKAVLGMAAAAERILRQHLIQGVISVPHGIQEELQKAGRVDMLLNADSPIRVMEGAHHNLPDQNAMEAASTIRDLANGLTNRDLLLTLISGGGSALLPAPSPPVSLEEKQELTKQLAAKGATIQELNTIRKALSQLKGGGLARYAYPAQVIGLILSDVIGDPMDLIASGPTVLSLSNSQECWEIFEKYDLCSSLPSSVREVLIEIETDKEPAGISRTDSSHTYNVIIGSNTLALEAASACAEQLGFLPIVLSPAVCGEVQAVSHLYGLLIRFACQALLPGGPSAHLRAAILQLGPEVGVPDWDLFRTLKSIEECTGSLCLLSGGEPTVQLQGKGKGGRNQELALRVAVDLSQGMPLPAGSHEVLFLSLGTDGQDGPTDSAGALSEPSLVQQAIAQGLNPSDFLKNNDSYSFFSQFSGGRCLIRTGLTGTNVMDVHLVLIQRTCDSQSFSSPGQ